MATEVEVSAAAAASHCGGDGWSMTALHRDGGDSQGFCISKLADHGSVSFGRYESEGLDWEKFSVFAPNRRKEDLAAPGFVAKKKAYFEEYFKGFRAMKGLLFKREEKGKGVDLCCSSSSSSNAVPIRVLEKEEEEEEDAADLAVECERSKGDSRADSGPKDGSKDAKRAKQGKKPVSAKGSVASFASNPKSGSRIDTDLGKRSKKLAKEANPARASMNTKPNPAPKSAASGVHVKSRSEKMVSTTMAETGLTTKPVSGKLPTSAQNTKGIPTVTGNQKRPSLANRNCNEVGKKSSSYGGCKSGGEPENLRPKSITTPRAANDATKAVAKPARIDTGRGEKQEKGMIASNARIGREPKPSPSKAKVVHPISSSKPDLSNKAKDSRRNQKNLQNKFLLEDSTRI